MAATIVRIVVLSLSIAVGWSATQQESRVDLPATGDAGDEAVRESDGERERSLSGDRLEAFIQANVAISRITAEYERRLGRPGTRLADAKRLQEEANEEVVSAIERAGLSPKGYRDMIMAIRKDPKLKATVSRRIYVHERQARR